MQSEFSALTDQYDKNKQAMLMLEDSYKMAVASVQHKLENAQDVISELNEKYENSIAVFKSESYTLKKKLDELKSQKSIPELMDNAACFANAPIVIRGQELAEKQKSRILKKDWEELSSAIATYYPDLVKDINGINNVTRQDIQTAFLVILNIRTDDIARLLRVSGQRITNIKSELNLAMFGYDPAQSKQPINTLKAWLQSLGIGAEAIKDMVVPVSQGYMTMNPLVGELEYYTVSPTPWLKFSKSPLWPFEFGNVYMEESREGLRKPLKQGSEKKVDNVHALLDACFCFDLQEGKVNP